MKNLLTTKIELGRCNRCSGYVFSAMVGGVLVAADPEPLDALAYAQALVARKPVYRLLEQSGRPYKLQEDMPSVPSRLPRLAAHDCGCMARDGMKVELVDEGPPSAPARRSAPPVSPRRPHALAGAQTPTQGFSSGMSGPRPAARPATQHPFKGCDACGRGIDFMKPHFSIEVGTRLVCAYHAECCK